MTKLERSFKMPECLGHTEVITEDDETFEYTAEASEIRFYDEDTIFAHTRLEKVQVLTTTRQVTRIRFKLHWWPFEKIRKTITKVNKRKIWEFETRFGSCIYLFRGELCGSREGGYKQKMRGVAASQGIVLTDELLDRVFGPINNKILDLYMEVAGLAHGGVPPLPRFVFDIMSAARRRPA